MAEVLDFSQKSSALILELINTKSKRPLKVEEITLGVATPNTDEAINRNTELLVTSSGTNPKLEGEGKIHYDRIDVVALFAPVHTALAVLEDDSGSAESVLAVLNARFKLGFSDEDFDFSTFKVEDDVITLEAKEDGLVYTGTLSINMEPNIEQLNILLGDGLLEGFVMPTLEMDSPVTFLNDYTTTYVDANGNLYTNPAYKPGKAMGATDGVLEIVVSTVNKDTAALYPPVDGAYAVTLANNAAFHNPVQLAIPAGLGDITAMYDISLDLGIDFQNRSVHVDLVNEGGKLVWKNVDDSAITVSDATVSPAKNIVGHMAIFGRWRQLYTGAPTSGTSSSAGYIGVTTVTVTAKRKGSKAEPIVLKVVTTSKK